jgi:putative peptidoglycan lipid II flippase
VLRGTSIVAGYTLLSRILGFVRDALVATLFGASAFADAYLVAFRLPNLLRSIFAEGALTSAFVPSLAPEAKKGVSYAQDAMSAVAGFLVVTTTIVSLLGIVFAPLIVDTIAPGFSTSPEQRELTILLSRIMMPYIVAVSIIALLNGTLNTFLIYGASAYAQVVMNLTLILGAFGCFFLSSPQAAAKWLSFTVLFGGVIQIICQLPALKRAGLSLRFSLEAYNPAVQSTFRLIVPALLGSGIYQITIFLTTLLSSLLEPGAISSLFYADRIVQLPLGVFSLALASVLLPTLSRAESYSDSDSFSRHLSMSVRLSLIVMVPLSGALFMFGPALVQILLQRGNFTNEASVRTADAIRMYSVGLWAVSTYAMISKAYSAKKDTKTPSILGLASLLVTVGVALFLLGAPSRGVNSSLGQVATFIAHTFPQIPYYFPQRHSGLAFASSVASIIICGTGIAVFHYVHTRLPLAEWTKVFVTTILATGIAMCITAYGLARWSFIQTPPLILLIGAGVLVFTALYVGLLLLIRNKEILLITARCLSKIKKLRS